MKMGHVIQVWGKPSKLLFRVKDHGDKWWPRHVLSAPPHLGIVGCHTLALQARCVSPRSDSRRARWARTCRGSSGPSDSPSASPHGTRPSVLGSALSADQHQHRECRRWTYSDTWKEQFNVWLKENKVLPSQHPMFNSRSIDADLAWIRRSRYSQLERRSWHVVSSILRWNNVKNLRIWNFICTPSKDSDSDLISKEILAEKQYNQNSSGKVLL